LTCITCRKYYQAVAQETKYFRVTIFNNDPVGASPATRTFNINWTGDQFPERFKIARERCNQDKKRTIYKTTIGALLVSGGAKIYAHGKGHRGSGNPYNGQGTGGGGGTD